MYHVGAPIQYDGDGIMAIGVRGRPVMRSTDMVCMVYVRSPGVGVSPGVLMVLV